ncbi:MAG: L-rhamnose mutarotase [Chloroflexi bacterium]|nr:L-rhamnose mutarotase [Chloroflexota bacterium]
MIERPRVSERAAFVLDIRSDKIADYVEAHAEVWPEMLAALKAAGIRNYSIFLEGTRAFGYFEADDLEEVSSSLAASESSARWQRAMAEFLSEPLPPSGPQTMREIFRLE